MKIILFFLLIFSFNSFAEDAQVIYAKGENTVEDSAGEIRKVVKGDILIEGEVLSTKENSFVILKIGKHSTHRVEESTVVEIEKLPYQFQNSEELEQGGSFVLQMGTVFSEIFKKSDDESFQIKTQNTTMGVRGTKFMASIDPDSNDAWVTVNEGTVEVKNSLSKANDIIEKDHSMVIEKDKNFTRQQRYEWQKNLKWKIAESKGEFKSFRQQRKMARQEFRQRRSDWVRNEERWGRFKERRKQKLTKFKERTKKFKSNEKLKKRKEKLKKLRAKRKEFKAKKGKLKEKRQLFNEGLRDKKKRKKQKRVNDFLEKRDPQKKPDNMKKRLQNMRKRRRQMRRK